jgi:S-adenosylmethionine/arginine decarboxylase-like enzyme
MGTCAVHHSVLPAFQTLILQFEPFRLRVHVNEASITEQNGMIMCSADLIGAADARHQL